MTKKKIPSKKSIEYVRPTPGTFTLVKFPGVEFSFRLINVDDESWCMSKFEKLPWAVMTAEKSMAADLCTLYFNFLTDECKQRFVPVRKEEMDYETGETKEIIVSGPRLFMQSIDGGNIVEMTLISHAFLQTILASRPIDSLPEEIKKNLLKQIQKNKEKSQPEPGPMGSQIVDLRPEKSQ